MSWQEQLPPALLAWLPELEASALACVRLSIQHEPPASPADSYLATAELEVEGERHQTAVFMQLNLAELPALPGLPSSGLLQLTIPSNDALYGVSAQQPLLWSLLTEGSSLPPLSDPLHTYYTIKGLADSMPMPPEDHRFPQQLSGLWDELGDERWPLLAAYRRAIGIAGHRLGGYAGFIQDDPRVAGDSRELFIQLDTDPAFGLQWGDMGRVHWFGAKKEHRSRSPDSSHDDDSSWLDDTLFNLEMS